MVMVEGTAEARMQAWTAAAQLCAGTGALPQDVAYVADVGLAYALRGTDAALARIAQGPPIPGQRSASAPQPSGAMDTGSSNNENSTAQTLANEAYLATSRDQVKSIMDRAHSLDLAGETIQVDGNDGSLWAYLDYRWASFRNSDLGL